MCGDVTMALEVKNTLIQVAKKNGLDDANATAFVENLIKPKGMLTHP